MQQDQNSIYMQDQRSRYQRSPSAPAGVTTTSQPAAGSVSSDVDSAQAKSKFPHGLTVHELKEMTKARLHAESFEKHDPDSSKGSALEQKRVSPLDFDTSAHEGRECALSRDSAGGNQARPQRLYVSDSMTSIPSMVQVNHPSREQQHLGRQPQMSPLPPGFQNFGPVKPSNSPFGDGTEVPGRMDYLNLPAPNAQRENRVQHPNVDAWETASVASHDYTVVSEYSGMVSQGAEDMGSIQFTRSRTYPAVAGAPDTPTSTSAASASPGRSFFGAAVGGPNRRRACTLSPRGLIHEDRPHFSGEQLGIPNFSSSTRSGPMLSRARNSYSPVWPPDNSRFGYGIGVIGGGSGDAFNRPRTSSTTSLPPISHTAEEFADQGLDRSVPLARFNSNQPLMGNNAIQEEVSSPVAERFLDVPYVSTGRDGPAMYNGASSVFRDVPSFHRPIPGLSGGNELVTVEPASSIVNPVFSRVGSMDSVIEARAISTWGSSSDEFLYSSVGVQNSAGAEESLSNDLGSILQLSGVNDRPDRERLNTYPSTSG
jgi:hypothetical protein